MKPPLINNVPLWDLFFLAAARCLFGGLERVDLKVFNLYLYLCMCRKVTDSVVPLLGRRRIGIAYLADAALYYALTTFAVLYYCLAGTFRKYTTLLTPKGTFGTCKYCLTLHSSSSSNMVQM